MFEAALNSTVITLKGRCCKHIEVTENTHSSFLLKTLPAHNAFGFSHRFFSLQNSLFGDLNRKVKGFLKDNQCNKKYLQTSALLPSDSFQTDFYPGSSGNCSVPIWPKRKEIGKKERKARNLTFSLLT